MNDWIRILVNHGYLVIWLKPIFLLDPISLPAPQIAATIWQSAAFVSDFLRSTIAY